MSRFDAGGILAPYIVKYYIGVGFHLPHFIFFFIFTIHTYLGIFILLFRLSSGANLGKSWKGGGRVDKRKKFEETWLSSYRINYKLLETIFV